MTDIQVIKNDIDMIKDENFNQFSLTGIFDQVRQNIQKIYAREDLEYVYHGRKFRFITPEGKFAYTTFGNFYFPYPDSMMLITKDRALTKYHQNDQMSDTLWSTVPVIFAGISTGYKDDRGREIFTGDIVTAKNMEYTSVVRYIEHTKCPSLAGDNCDLMFNMCQDGLHIEGTVFCDMKKEMFSSYQIQDAFWPTAQYYGSMTRQEVIEKASKALDTPHFTDKLIAERGNAACYLKIEDAMHGNFELVVMQGEDYEDLDGEPVSELIIDNFPEGYEGKCHFLKVVDHYDPIVKVKEPIMDFMYYAHRNPDTKYILGDFSNSFAMTKQQKQQLAMLLYPLHEYNITNFIVPSWITLHWVTNDTMLYAQD